MRDFKSETIVLHLSELQPPHLLAAVDAVGRPLLTSTFLLPLPAGLQQDPPEGVNACPKADNIMQWNAIIFGPDGTIWDGGVFKLTMEFSEEYPNKAPVVKFKTRLFHPNGMWRGYISRLLQVKRLLNNSGAPPSL